MLRTPVVNRLYTFLCGRLEPAPARIDLRGAGSLPAEQNLLLALRRFPASACHLEFVQTSGLVPWTYMSATSMRASVQAERCSGNVASPPRLARASVHNRRVKLDRRFTFHTSISTGKFHLALNAPGGGARVDDPHDRQALGTLGRFLAQPSTMPPRPPTPPTACQRANLPSRAPTAPSACHCCATPA